MKKPLSLFAFLSSAPSFACTFCSRPVRDALFDSRFYPNLAAMLSAFIVLGIIVAVLAVISARRHTRLVAAYPDRPDPVPLFTASVITGIGMGGFIDGIVLHQILQWHEMLSNKVAVDTVTGKTVNMFWDGLFHAFCFLVLSVGLVRLWTLLKRTGLNTSGHLLSGGLLSGWGIFNLVEGLIDHHLLKLHNVRELADHDAWNFGFLGFSMLLLLVGFALVRRATRA
jgi:uncharacterized membrane protein